MADYPGFDPEKVHEAIQTAHDHYAGHRENAIDNAMKATQSAVDDGHLSVAAQCISVTVQNGKVCVNLPLVIGSICVPIPVSFPNGTAAQACISICTTWGIPTGVRLTVSIAGVTIINKTFLKC